MPQPSIDILPLGPLMTNCYVIRGGGDCWVVDAAMWPAGLLENLRQGGVAPSRILLTHGHGDHIAGIPQVKQAYPQVKVLCPAADADMLTDASLNMSADFGMPIQVPPADELIQPGQSMQCGDSVWQVLDTSGHTPGGVSYYCPEAAVVLSGDALFEGSIGRCDLPGSDQARLVRNIHTNLLTLPPATVVLSGHGEATTIAREKVHNPWL